MKFENNEQLLFGYEENEPVTAEARIKKNGGLQDKTITWTIRFTPRQNPDGKDGIAPDAPFQLRDTLDTGAQSYEGGSVEIDGAPIPEYASRDQVTGTEDAYVAVEPSESQTVLIFGGKWFGAVESTRGDPAPERTITYRTTIHDELLLPAAGGAGGGRVSNAAGLFGYDGNEFRALNVKDSASVTVSQPPWLTKTGKTVRHDDGSGSTTDWTVTFLPNGFSFGPDQALTLHDQLPQGSTLVENSVTAGIKDGAVLTGTAVTAGPNNDFTVSGIETDNQIVEITYQTHVPEEMYDNGTSLGSNTAWFTFQYGEKGYETPKKETPVGSGDGTGTPGTATLIKDNRGYRQASRTIDWTVTINPHKADLKGGTFTDALSEAGPVCGVAGHGHGLELAGGRDGVSVLVNGAPDGQGLVTLDYDNQQLTVTVGNAGRKTITLAYTTKVCDPCVFANNTKDIPFKNTISTEDMVIGSSGAPRKTSADSTAKAGAAVLAKNKPVYHYETGLMEWSVLVDASGLPMDRVRLTDELQAGLTYVDGSLKTSPALPDASASVSGQELAIDLGRVERPTTVTFDTRVDPEALGFAGDRPVTVENTIHMDGRADGVEFARVSHRVEQSFSNHGLVKSGAVNDRQELIQYEVLINPFGLALPEHPSLEDTLDKRLQLDADTLRFYRASLTGTTSARDQKPGYIKEGTGQPLKISGFDPAENRFAVDLPISGGSQDAYVLAYTADIMNYQKGGYGNSVRFAGGSVLLGGSKTNTASASGGGGGGGGGGAAARKASISIVKTDSETRLPLSGVSFLLYQWDADLDARGLPAAQGRTDGQGKLSFQVKPGAFYELVETESVPGYGSAFQLANAPAGVTQTEGGLLVKAGDAKTELTLELANDAHTTDLVFRLVSQTGVPLAGETVRLYTANPDETPGAVPVKEAAVLPNGTVRFPGIRRGARYFVPRPGGGILTIDVPAQAGAPPGQRCRTAPPRSLRRIIWQRAASLRTGSGKSLSARSPPAVNPLFPGRSSGCMRMRNAGF